MHRNRRFRCRITEQLPASVCEQFEIARGKTVTDASTLYGAKQK